LFGSWSQGNDYLSGDGTTIPSNFLRESFGFDAGLKINSLNQVRITTTYNRARNSDFPSLPMDLISDDTWLFNAKHEYRPTSGSLTKLSTNVYASLVDHIMSNELKSLDPRMVNAITEAQTFNLGGRTEALWNVPNGLLYTGADLRMDGAEGIREREFLMGPNAGRVFLDNVWQTSQITKTAFFAEYQLGQGNWQWVLATRLEANQATSNEPADQFTGLYESSNSFQFNPSVSLGSIYRLNSEMAISGWLGRAQRSGGLTEKFINFFPVGLDPYELVGNPELKPEVNNQLDLGWQWKSGGNGINIDVYASWLQNYISGAINPDIQPRLPASPGVRQFTNIGEAFKTGFEIQWAQQLWEGINQRGSVAYTYGQDVEKDQPLPEIAPLDARYQIFAGFLNNKLQPEISFRYVMDQDRVSLEYGEKSTPSFAILDIRASWQVISNLKITAGINNLLDQNYYEHLSRSINSETPIYAPGRSFVVSFNVVF
jgi:iron complex outermembrane receptor protein